MNLSNTQRTLKLIVNLATYPRLILPWIRTLPVWRLYPLELELPWWSFLAIEEGDRRFEGKKIFEYGTGGSTVRYGKVAKSVYSVEDDKAWFERVLTKAKDIPSVTVQHCHFDFKTPRGFEKSDYLLSVAHDTWDVIVIDGQDWTFRERITCFEVAEQFIAPGGIIVVDDFWRYEALLQKNKAQSVRVFESTGPCRYGVTSTAFFYY